ncbi:MAG: SET domain-containing protein-lysine N-methyltransferase [Kiritimatiellae bacterium]|nr:SET domain-containing protein-lysine N-methyltransferase [Kiritimatiellia bacterium]MCO5068927.1 SET domain-containing protein-lysine N-methyltransferase [Kiritimatiellia bacterium]
MQMKLETIEARRSPIHGMGVFALKKIPRGTQVIEYKGKRVKWDPNKEKKNGHTELFHVTHTHVLNPRWQGNIARYINHSCAPNCEAVQEGEQIFIYAIRDIQPGEELFYSYGLVLGRRFTRDDVHRYLCRCGSAKCRGAMLSIPPSRRAQVKRWARQFAQS